MLTVAGSRSTSLTRTGWFRIETPCTRPYLEIIEKAVSGDTNTGAYDRAIGLARRALELDPEAEQIEFRS